jgi:DNA-binding transcriptional LysR family regulator
MKIEEIETLLEFAQAGNAEEAARRLGISAPTLAERLKNLEKSLPHSPFTWRGHKRILSSYGMACVRALSAPMAELHRASRRLASAENPAASFRVAGRMELLSRIALTRKSDIRLMLDPCPSKEALEKLQNGRVDVAITHERGTRQEWVRARLFASEMVWICAPRLCPLELQDVQVADGKTDWSAVEKLPWFSYKDEDPWLEDFVRQTRLDGVRNRIQLWCENWFVIRDLVQAGKGVAVAPRGAILGGSSPMKCVSLGPAPHQEPFFAVYHRDFAGTARGRTLIKEIKAAFGE